MLCLCGLPCRQAAHLGISPQDLRYILISPSVSLQLPPFSRRKAFGGSSNRKIKLVIKPFPQIPGAVERCTPPVAFFADEVFAAVEVRAGVLVFGVVFSDGGIAVVTPGAGIVGFAGHGDQALLPGFVLNVAGDAPSDKVVGCFAQVGLFRLVEAFFELGQDDEFGALLNGVIDDLFDLPHERSGRSGG